MTTLLAVPTKRQRIQARRIQEIAHERTGVPDFPRIEKVVRWLDRLPPGRLLDVGYARGSFADSLAQRGWQCIGLDLYPSEASVPLVRCDLNDGLPIRCEGVDAITAGEVIEHLLDEEAFLRECHRVLKKDGRLILTTPNLSFWVNRLLVLLGKTPIFVTAPYHYHFHTRLTLTRLVKAQGFQVERIAASHLLYSRRRHFTGWIFEWLGDLLPSFGAHLILFARKL